MSIGSIDLQLAIADLTASRARLREVLLPPPPDPNAPRGKSLFGGITDGVGSLWNALKGMLGDKGSPGSKGGGVATALSMALDAVQSWWASHPWRQIGNSVAVPLGVAALPLVRRHPWATVLAASVAGALVIKARPWRWRLVSQQAHLVRRQAVRWALSQAAKPAVQALVATAIASLMSNLNQKKPGTGNSAAAQGSPHAAAASPAAVVHPAGPDAGQPAP